MKGLIIRQLSSTFDHPSDINLFAIIKREEVDKTHGYSYVKGYPIGAMWNGTVMVSSTNTKKPFHLEFK